MSSPPPNERAAFLMMLGLVLAFVVCLFIVVRW